MNGEPCVCGTPFTCAADHATTTWCDECDGSADVVDDWHPETDPHGVEWQARRLDCGHEEVTAR